MQLHLSTLSGPAQLADEALLRMPSTGRDELAREAQRHASSLGLMRGPTPIPLVLSPSSLPRAEHLELGRGARLLTSALVKVARDVIERRPEKARVLFRHLSPLETEALATRWREAEDLLHSRVDWFVDKAGAVRALELNATIPAMQVYSDAAASGWTRATAPGRLGALVRNPANAPWLVDALLRAAARTRQEPFRVQILHRVDDPQLTELAALAVMLRDRGIEARTCTPDEIALDGDPHRVLYRHLFARYVEPQSALGRAFLDPERHGMWNRVDGWLETKGLFAELSVQVRAPFLTDEEQAAVAELVPWTRLLDDVADSELGDGDGCVLKKSHDYGGKSVVIGREAGPAAFRDLLAHARRDLPGTWVVQELVDAPAVERFLCDTTGARRLHLHLDISTYASLVPGVPDGGSVCRAAPGRVVNIAGGGGVAPLFTDDVLSELV